MRFIGKLVAYLLAGILSVVVVLFDLIGRILSFLGVFVVFTFVAGLIVIVISRSWQSLPLLVGLFSVCVIIFFGSAIIAGYIARCRDWLLGR